MTGSSYNKKNFFKSKGLYITAALCIAAAGAGVWGAVGGLNTNKEDATAERTTINWNIGYSEPATQLETQANNPIKNVPDTRNNTTSKAAEQTTENDKNTPYTGYYALPMGTNITKDYSAGEMVKNTTTNDWRVHSGIDFGGAKGNDVLAIQDGTVTKVYKDSLWGNVVEIDHGKSLTAKYCGLADSSLPKVGDKVRQFDHIGTLGEIPVESADGDHLHLEITVGGKTVDPLEAMNKLGTTDTTAPQTTTATTQKAQQQ